MGGDDLGSDDEGWLEHVSAPTDNDDDHDSNHSKDEAASRKRQLTSSSNSLVDSSELKPKQKKGKSVDRLLLEAGRNIQEQSAQEQATFLTTAAQHYGLMATEKGSPKVEDISFLPLYFCTSSKESLLERIKDVVSLKKVRKWKQMSSPYMVIACISARRAVQVLKQLSSLNVRTAKLFPKNGSVSDQREQLRTSPFGIAVGTPHRLQVLSTSQDESEAALSFEHTQLVILDSELSNKQYTVATLPDTAPYCMALLREQVLPQLQKRQNIKLAFF